MGRSPSRPSGGGGCGRASAIGLMTTTECGLGRVPDIPHPRPSTTPRPRHDPQPPSHHRGDESPTQMNRIPVSANRNPNTTPTKKLKTNTIHPTPTKSPETNQQRPSIFRNANSVQHPPDTRAHSREKRRERGVDRHNPNRGTPGELLPMSASTRIQGTDPDPGRRSTRGPRGARAPGGRCSPSPPTAPDSPESSARRKGASSRLLRGSATRRPRRRRPTADDRNSPRAPPPIAPGPRVACRRDRGGGREGPRPARRGRR